MKPFEKASWITRPSCGGMNLYSSFYETVTITEGRGAVLRICAFTDYCVYENGQPILPLSGQFPCYEEKPVYDEIGLDGVLSPGTHALKIVLYTVGADTSTHRKTPHALIYEFRDKDGILAFSSGDTRCEPEAHFVSGDPTRVTGQLGFSFRYHADGKDGTALTDAEEIALSDDFQPRPVRKLVCGKPIRAGIVDAGTYTDTGSAGTDAIRMAQAKLRTAGGPFDTDGTKEHRLTADGGGGVYLIADLGAEQAGLISFELTLPSAAEITIGWGEHLHDGVCEDAPAGRARTWIGGRSFAAVYRGTEGVNRFTMPFLRFGCRYLELHIAAPEVVIRSLCLIPTVYPLDRIASVRTPDPVWNDIYDVSVRTLRLCMHEHYEDCPWREQALYAMDSRNQMLCGYDAFGETRFALASLRLMADSLRDDGMMELCSPARVSITIPSFTAIFLTQVLEYYEFSRDTVGTLGLMPAVEKIADAFLKRIDPAVGLISCYPEERYWNFYEWQDGLAGSISGSVAPEDMTYDAPLNAFVSMGMRSAAKLCRAFGKEEKAVTYGEAHLSLNRAVNAAFWDEEKGAYATYLAFSGGLTHFCELTNALAVCCGAAKEERETAVLQKLSDGVLIPVTLSYGIFKYDALLSRSFEVKKTFAEIRSLWKRMLDDGATSFYETIDGEPAFGGAGSLCHGWSAVPVYLLHRYALHADPRLTGVPEPVSVTGPDPLVI